ncbi:MAG: SDR family NAD(P)-dependent oxidoreductase [Bacteroidota bacterium]
MSKQAIVSGGTKGIGREIVRQLVAKEYAVCFTGRDEAAGQEVVQAIRHEFPQANIQYQQGDLGTVENAKQLAIDIRRQFPQIDLLVNNAGVWSTTKKLNADGIEISYMVNHLAPLIMIHGLYEQLKAAAPSRVVNVNSGLYVRGAVDLEQTPYGKDFHRLNTYANSKLANAMATIELVPKLEADGITINALHPGVINTGLGDFTGLMGGLLKLVKRFWATPEKGAQAPVMVGTDPGLEGTTGKYFFELKQQDWAPNTQDVNLRKELWDQSLDMAGISWN